MRWVARTIGVSEDGTFETEFVVPRPPSAVGDQDDLNVWAFCQQTPDAVARVTFDLLSSRELAQTGSQIDALLGVAAGMLAAGLIGLGIVKLAKGRDGVLGPRDCGRLEG
jgi:hypothetical protein